MIPVPPSAGTVSAYTAEEPISPSSVQNVAAVVVGAHEDGTPVVEVTLGRVSGPSLHSTVHYLTDLDLIEDLGVALVTVAEGLRQGTAS